MNYRYCGNSGLQLPLISLGLWHNFGFVDNLDVANKIIIKAFEKGITHFDLANNYGPPPGSAEINFGKILKKQFSSRRDELLISSKAGHLMWDGPYGNGGSRKYLVASIDQSLKRTGLEYFDIFYSHRYDPYTPLEETMGVLADIVKQGKALYVGISNYPAPIAQKACELLTKQNVPCLIFQDKYSMLVRDIEKEKIDIAARNGAGIIAFSPLAQGLLSSRYLNGIPADSRAAKSHGYLKVEQIAPKTIEIVENLNKIAMERGQTMAQLAIAWTLRNPKITSVVLGASSVDQLEENLESINNLLFSPEELNKIELLIEN